MGGACLPPRHETVRPGQLGAEGKHRLSINILSLEKDAGRDVGN